MRHGLWQSNRIRRGNSCPDKKCERVSHVAGNISGLKRNIWSLSDGRHADSYYRETGRANGWKKFALQMKVDCLFDREELDIEKVERLEKWGKQIVKFIAEM